MGIVVSGRRALNFVLWSLFFAIGVPRMARVGIPIVTTHGADFICPALLYTLMRQNRTLLRRFRPERPSAVFSASSILAACFAWELSQRFDLSGTPLDIARGTFDPWDLVA